MNLGFSQTINGQPTYFIEKIWESIINDVAKKNTGLVYINYQIHYLKKFGKYWDGADDSASRRVFAPKRHTIRQDPKGRWKAGMNIHFVINSRTKDRFQFAPVLPCISVQDIAIEYVNGFMVVYVDGNPLNVTERLLLARMDGFDSIEHFKTYFDKDFRGKIIHWTKLKY